MSEKESERERIVALLRSYPKGLTIDEVSRLLSISRPTAAKYLNSMVSSGQAELRELGRAKLFYLTQRLPLMNLLSLASDLIMILDGELFIREVNDSFLSAFHLDREKLKGLKIEHSLVAPYFSEQHLSALKVALAGNASTFELPAEIGDEKRYFRMNLTPLIFEGGGHGAGILLEDITAMKEYQRDLEEQVRLRTAALSKTNDALQKEIEEHKKTEDALSMNEARMKRAEGVAKFGNWEIHLDTRQIILSEGARALFGITERESSMERVRSLILEEYRGLREEARLDLIEKNKPYNIEYQVQRPDGSTITIHSIAEYDPGQNTLFGVIHDVSEQKLAEEVINRATKQIVLLNTVTRHDILNQLNALSGYIGLMKKQTLDEKSLELTQKEEQVADTIRRQITFTRDYQNIGLQPPRWTNIETMVKKAIITMDPEGTAIEIKTGTLELFTDLLIEKVYFNLVDNSLRHGGRVSRIGFHFRKEDQGLTLIYEDDGQGIPDADKSQIFDRGLGKNTGFGLFLVKEILSITGFTVRECGTYGNGARFEISIPDGSYRFGENPGLSTRS
jgi:PAS domain S-box-containing protein